jgi:malonyl-CoA/methylmalonyl-CoA synthetase
VDIIKSSGYKLSALDIESALLQHPQVAETAVVGVPDDARGQIVTALVYPKARDGASVSAGVQKQLIAELKQLCAQSLASYSIPRKWLILDAPLPRNAMGKVNKKELLREYAGQLQQA